MYSKLLVFALAISSIIFFACNKRQPDGMWSDNILLSGKTFTFNATGDSVIVTAKGKWWSMNCVALDTHRMNVCAALPTTDVCNFVYTDGQVSLTSTDCNQLFIKMAPNTTNAERTLSIGLSAGDYFDGIKVVQKKQ
jgi:hypothetical protein